MARASLRTNSIASSTLGNAEPRPIAAGQRFAANEGQAQERLTAVFAEIEDGADIGMPQRGGGASFAQEAGDRYERAREFDGDGAIQLRIVSEIDSAHAAFAELALDAISADLEQHSGRRGRSPAAAWFRRACGR